MQILHTHIIYQVFETNIDEITEKSKDNLTNLTKIQTV